MSRLATWLMLLALAAPPLFAELGWNGASSNIVVEEATRARRLADPAPVIATGILEDSLEGSCVLAAHNDRGPRKGVRGTVRARLIDANTFAEIETLATSTARTGKDGTVSFPYDLLPRGGFAQQVALVAEVDLKGRKRVTFVSFSCAVADTTP